MWKASAILTLLLALMLPEAAACPQFTGNDPRADLKAALDYFPSAVGARAIAGADCAYGYYRTSTNFEQAFRAEASSHVYRYGRFLSEAADLQHRAARRVRQTGGGRGLPYFENEIQIRKTLLTWCLADPTVCSVHREMGSLANAYELADKAESFHDWMVGNSPRSLEVGDALTIWLRGLASCPVWDFRPPTADSTILWKAACYPVCQSATRDASQVFHRHEVASSSARSLAEAMTRALRNCPDPQE